MGHTDSVHSVAWSPDGQLLASGGHDKTIRMWNCNTGQQTEILQGHTFGISCVAFSPDGRLLASKDGEVCLWHRNKMEPIVTLFEPHAPRTTSGLAFHPHEPLLATLGNGETVIQIWFLDIESLLERTVAKSVHYTNAKVVLMGETSTGKTCLARALVGEPFLPQESTHGIRVWTLRAEAITRPDGGQVDRETFLWDLAGQTDYQVVHQLFLDDTALGLVLFDSTHPENPFGGVGIWEKALKRVAGKDCPKILVAGRVDRGRPTVTSDDIEVFRQEHEFIEYIPTSSKTDEGVDVLRAAIARAILWQRLPVTSSPGLWKDMRDYLLKRRDGSNVLTRRSDLRESFHYQYPNVTFAEDDFDTVIGHAQAQGLLWRLSFGDFILLRPELLNAYASAVVSAARRHPKGLGCVFERDVLDAKIEFEDLERLSDAATERSLLHAVVELFLSREVALREGDLLVFPSKFNRTYTDYPDLAPREVAYRFAGPVEEIYATLVVRLFYSEAFDLVNLRKYMAEYRSPGGSLCRFVLSDHEEGQGEMSVFFERTTSLETKVLFLKFIQQHLQRRALSDSVVRKRVYRCPDCGWEVTDRAMIRKKLKRGDNFIRCLDCDNKIVLMDLLEEKFGDPALLRHVQEMDKEVEGKKGEQVSATTIKAKEEIGEFDVFLCHNGQDKGQVEAIGKALKRRGLNPWLDKWNLPPGRRFAEEIERVLPLTKAVAVFVGGSGPNPWTLAEIYASLNLFVEKKRPVIPILLPNALSEPQLPLFLRQFSWVRFTSGLDDPEPLDKLVWGITGIYSSLYE